MTYQLLYYDKIYIYAKNIEQSTYPDLTKTFKPISDEIGYDVFESRLTRSIKQTLQTRNKLTLLQIVFSMALKPF